MNNFKKTLFFILTIGFTASVFFSCEDDFTEQDLLNLQNQLARENDSLQTVRNTDALNQAGELVSYLVKVVTNDNTPVEGASVSLLASTGGTASTTTLTTDVDGQVYFDQVVIGGNILSISAAGFFDVTADVNFGQITEGTHYEIINGEVIPLQVVESSILPLFGDGSGTELGTLRGTVQIETDLTNDSTEVVDGVELVADLANFATLFARDGSLTPSLYVFDSDLTVGRATSDANGNYTMQIPTTADGLSPEIVVPVITRTQRLAAKEVDNVPLARPEYFDVEAQFGPNLGSSGIPDVPGIIVQASAPSAAGAGFGLTLTRYGRALTAGTLTAQSFTTPTEFLADDMIFHFTSVGEGYENSPQVTVADAGAGNGADVEAHIQFAITGLTVATAGDAAADTDIFLDLVYDEVQNNITDGDTDTTFDITQANNILTVRTDAAGAVTADSVAAALAQAIANDDVYFDPENPQSINDWVSGLRLVGIGDGATTDPVVTVSGATGIVEDVNINAAGEDYETPTFTFSGGGATTQAALTLVEFGTQWQIAVDNSGVTTAYNVLPEDVSFEYIDVVVGDRAVQTSGAVTDPINGGAPDILDILQVDGSGNIVFNDNVNSYVTNFNAPSAPRVIVDDPQAQQIQFEIQTFFTVNDDGSINNLAQNISETGEGYAARPTLTIVPAAVGAPGSGAIIVAVDGDFLDTGEFQWGGNFDLTHPGSGYLENLNQANQAGYQGTQSNDNDFNIFIRPGETIVHDIDYGTGVRIQDYN